jgi:clostripain
MKKLLFFTIIFLMLSLNFCSPPQGGGPIEQSTDEYELVNGEANIKDTTGKEEIWFSINAGVGLDYQISWLEAENSAYTGDVIISAYRQDRITPYFTGVDSGSLSIHTDNCSQVFIKVKRNGNDGTFSIKYDITSADTPDTWTIMFYFNGSDLEPMVVEALEQIINNYNDKTGVNIIFLLDRDDPPHQTSLFNPEFSDTRLFMATPAGIMRIGGGSKFPEITKTSAYEANMGAAATLKNFINFSKANFLTQNYALFFLAHGEASKGFGGDKSHDGDSLHPGEISSILGSEHSVNIIGFESCLMGNIETAYQFRKDVSNTGFSAEYFIASPTYLHCPPEWNYASIITRISRDGGDNGEEDSLNGGTEQIYNPASMTALEFSVMILEEFKDKNDFDTISCYDLAKISALKSKADELAVSIYANNEKIPTEAIRDDDKRCTHYYQYNENVPGDYEHNRMLVPYFELYDLCDEIEDDNNFCLQSRNLATQVKNLIDNVILYSYFGEDTTNARGMSIFFSPGDDVYDGNNIFAYHWWFNALDVSTRGAATDSKYTGLLSWCINRTTDVTGQVDNWFEMIDAFYDGGGNNPDGGWNEYQY